MHLYASCRHSTLLPSDLSSHIAFFPSSLTSSAIRSSPTKQGMSSPHASLCFPWQSVPLFIQILCELLCSSTTLSFHSTVVTVLRKITQWIKIFLSVKVIVCVSCWRQKSHHAYFIFPAAPRPVLNTLLGTWLIDSSDPALLLPCHLSFSPTRNCWVITIILMFHFTKETQASEREDSHFSSILQSLPLPPSRPSSITSIKREVHSSMCQGESLCLCLWSCGLSLPQLCFTSYFPLSLAFSIPPSLLK